MVTINDQTNNRSNYPYLLIYCYHSVMAPRPKIKQELIDLDNYGNSYAYKHQEFVYEYLVDMDVRRASEAVGAAVNTGRAWLKLPAVNDAIARGMMVKARRNCASADYVMDKLMAILETSLDDFLVIPEFGIPYYDLSKATPAQRAVIESIEITTKSGTYGDHNVQQVVRTKLTMPSKLKAIELLGKHVDVQAFRERVDVTMHSTEEKLLAGRKRALIQGQSERLPNGSVDKLTSGGTPPIPVYLSPDADPISPPQQPTNNNPTNIDVTNNNSDTELPNNEPVDLDFLN